MVHCDWVFGPWQYRQITLDSWTHSCHEPFRLRLIVLTSDPRCNKSHLAQMIIPECLRSTIYYSLAATVCLLLLEWGSCQSKQSAIKFNRFNGSIRRGAERRTDERTDTFVNNIYYIVYVQQILIAFSVL